MLPHSKLDSCASLTLGISFLQDTKPPAASQKQTLGGDAVASTLLNTCRLKTYNLRTKVCGHPVV